MSKFNILPQFHDYMLEFTQCFVYFFLLCNDKNKSILILTICTVKTCFSGDVTDTLFVKEVRM